MAQLVIEVPDAIAARVGQALRAAYPDVTAGLETDGQVARAVFAWLVGNLLAQYEVDRVRAAKTQAVRAAQADLDSSVEAARMAAWQIVQSIVPVPIADTEKEG